MRHPVAVPTTSVLGWWGGKRGEGAAIYRNVELVRVGSLRSRDEPDSVGLAGCKPVNGLRDVAADLKSREPGPPLAVHSDSVSGPERVEAITAR